MLRERSRPGATLAELLVALTLAGVVLATATSTVLRQQRTSASLGHGAGVDAQFRAALGALSLELGALAAGSGDLEAGQATDTAVQLRALITSGVSCGDAVGSATFVEEESGVSGALLGAAAHAGDSLWWLAGAPLLWRGRRVVASDSVTAPCQLTSAVARPVRRIAIAEPDSIPYGAPLRITRPMRYAFYRSGDGSWQLGVREWVDATSRFASPQPIAGPFLMRAGGTRTGFRFYDADGEELGVGGLAAAGGRIARVRVTVVSAARRPTAATDTTAARDSIDVALQSSATP